MKNRPIPPIDLANIASLPVELRRHRLEKLKDGYCTWSYDPTRKTFSDSLNCDTELFESAGPTDWITLKSLIAQRSKAGTEYDQNLAVTGAIHTYARKNNIRSRQTDFFPMTFSHGPKISFWAPLVFVSGKKPVIPFIDPRVSEKLTAEGRTFAFSVMHERIRASDPDFYETDLLILQFIKDKKTEFGRKIVENYHKSEKLLSYDELDNRVTETYQIWESVQFGRDEKKRKSGGSGPLL